jgi:hypothetical protein
MTGGLSVMACWPIRSLVWRSVEFQCPDCNEIYSDDDRLKCAVDTIDSVKTTRVFSEGTSMQNKWIQTFFTAILGYKVIQETVQNTPRRKFIYTCLQCLMFTEIQPSENWNLTPLDFCFYVSMENEVYKRKAVARHELLDRVLGAAVCVRKREDQLRRKTRDFAQELRLTVGFSKICIVNCNTFVICVWQICHLNTILKLKLNYE